MNSDFYQQAAAAINGLQCEPNKPESCTGDEITQYQCEAAKVRDALSDILNCEAKDILDMACLHIKHPAREDVFNQVKKLVTREIVQGQDARLLWHPDATKTLNLVCRLNMLLSLLQDAQHVMRTVMQLAINSTRIYAATGKIEPPIINLNGELQPGQQAGIEAAKMMGLPPENIRDGSVPAIARIVQVN